MSDINEINLIIDNSSQILNITEIEHYIDGQSQNSKDLTFKIFQVISVLIISSTNGYLLYFISSQPSKTFLDWMMFIDSILSISNVIIIGGIGLRRFCFFLPFFGYFINVCNRLLTVGIVIYRYIFVVKSSMVWTSQQRRAFSTLIFGSILISTVVSTGWASYYRYFFLQYLGKFDLHKIFRVYIDIMELSRQIGNDSMISINRYFI